MTEPETVEVNLNGRVVVLDGDRKVTAFRYEDSWILRFENGCGGLQDVTISDEAGDALVTLLSEPKEIHQTINPDGPRLCPQDRETP